MQTECQYRWRNAKPNELNLPRIAIGNLFLGFGWRRLGIVY